MLKGVSATERQQVQTGPKLTGGHNWVNGQESHNSASNKLLPFFSWERKTRSLIGSKLGFLSSWGENICYSSILGEWETVESLHQASGLDWRIFPSGFEYLLFWTADWLEALYKLFPSGKLLNFHLAKLGLPSLLEQPMGDGGKLTRRREWRSQI